MPELPEDVLTEHAGSGAQAMGGLRVLDERGRPVLHVHLLDRRAALQRLLKAARS